jgi:hypothetical protein
VEELGMIPTAEEIANEIRMLCVASTGPLLLVEGPSDVKFFSQHTVISVENILPSFGFDKLIEAIAFLQGKYDQKVVAVIDLDYRGLVDSCALPNNIITTDSHDLETMMFDSGAFEKVLKQKSSIQKLKSYPKGSQGVKKRILKLSKPIGCLRFYSSLKGKSYSFENINFEKFIDRKSLSFSTEKLVSHLRGIHPNNSSMHAEVLKQSLAETEKIVILRDPLRLCCGHDLMEVMAIGLKSVWGSHSGRRISGSLLEELFMLAYSQQMFRVTGLFQKLDKWFNERAYGSVWCE